MLGLEHLGYRICLIGPSNSGKSTLAERLASKMNVPAFHLDQLAHVSHTNWQRRSDQELVDEHEKIIALDKWIIDGNYSVCMPQRFQRATAIIWLDPPLMGFIYRYLKRSIIWNKSRAGGLEGAKREFNLSLVKYTFSHYPKNRTKYERLLKDYRLPMLRIHSMCDLNDYYRYWDLSVTQTS